MTTYLRNPVLWVAVCVITLGLFFSVVKANPSLFTTNQTNSATTTVTYLTAGTATTTLTYDANLLYGDSFASNGASLLIQFAGSSSASTLNADIQYSQDGIDWYGLSGGTDVDNGIGSTSPSIGNATVVTLTFASSTIDKSAGITATTSRIVNLDMPTRYVRAIFSLPAGSPRGAVWAQFVAQKQNR